MDLVRLNYGTVEQIIFSACSGVEYITGKNKDGSATLKSITQEYLDKELLLPTGLDPEEIEDILEGGERRSGYTPSRLSKFRKEGKLPKKYIAAFSMKQDIYDRVEKSFTTEGSLITFIRDDNMYRAMHEFNKLITTDNTIPEVYRKTFNKLCSKDTFWKYLAHIFIFAVMRDTNTKIKELEEQEKNKEKIHPLIERVICELAIYGKSETFESTLDFIDMSLMQAKTVEDCPIGGADLVALYKGAVEYKEQLSKKHLAIFEQIREDAYVYELYDISAKLGSARSSLMTLARKYGYDEYNFDINIDRHGIGLTANINGVPFHDIYVDHKGYEKSKK